MSTLAAETPSKRTPLFQAHVELSARFTEFSGWNMPVLYSGLVEEHLCVRSAAGLFDVSHMGEVRVNGPKAFKFLQAVTTNDITKIEVGYAQYSLLLNTDGGVVDDIIIYRLGEQEYLLCINAGNTEKDWEWLQRVNTFGAELKNESEEFGQIALQGPRSREILAQLIGTSETSLQPAQFPAFSFRTIKLELQDVGSSELIIACTGYTGEDGFEFFCPSGHTAALWKELLIIGRAFGAKPIGLGARDSLRLEACYPLHGHELREDLCALSCGVSWAIKLGKGDFLGREALLSQKAAGLKYKLVGLEVTDRGIIREGIALKDSSGREIGWVSSGTKPPTVNKAIGLGFVPESLSAIDTPLLADVRGKDLAVKVIKRPFYKRSTSGGKI